LKKNKFKEELENSSLFLLENFKFKFSNYPVYLNILIGPDNRTFISLSTGGIKDLISVIHQLI